MRFKRIVYGHPFKDPQLEFDDLYDYCLALSRGTWLERMTGMVSVSPGIIQILDTNFTASYDLENSDDTALKKEIREALVSHTMPKNGLSETVRLDAPTCFAVVMIRFEMRKGELISHLTAIEKETGSLITVFKESQNSPFQCNERSGCHGYVDMDCVMQPFLDIFVNSAQEGSELLKSWKEYPGSWIREGRCKYCGGSFKGLFAKKCVVCGKKKDY